MFRFLKVFLMLAWRTAVLNGFVLILLPSWSVSPMPLLGIALIAAAVLVFGMRRTLLTFPIIRLLNHSNPLPSEDALKVREAEARERARRRTPEYRAALQKESEQQRIEAMRRRELEYAEQVERIRAGEADHSVTGEDDPAAN